MGKNDVAKELEIQSDYKGYIDSILQEVRHIDNKPKTDFELYGHSFEPL